jgi:hypothetical protein
MKIKIMGVKITLEYNSINNRLTECLQACKSRFNLIALLCNQHPIHPYLCIAGFDLIYSLL